MEELFKNRENKESTEVQVTLLDKEWLLKRMGRHVEIKCDSDTGGWQMNLHRHGLLCIIQTASSRRELIESMWKRVFVALWMTCVWVENHSDPDLH